MFTGEKKKTTANDLLELGYTTGSQEYLAAQTYFKASSVPYACYIGNTTSYTDTLSAITDMRNNSDWYVCILTNEVAAALTNITAVSLGDYIESAVPSTALAMRITAASSTITAAMQAKLYGKTLLMYDGITANEALTSPAAIIGYAMGMAKSNKTYDLAYKSLNGVTPYSVWDSTADGSFDTLINGYINVYVTQGYYYNVLRQGRMLSGTPFDEMAQLDMLISTLQSNMMDVFVNNAKVPGTEDGLGYFENALTSGLEQFVSSGFIAPGVWQGAEVLGLSVGDTLSKGYLIQFDSFSTLSSADRTARKAPNCYIAIKLAGAIEYVVIGLYVSR